MTYYTVVDDGNSVDELEKDLNTSLEVYTGVTAIVSCELTYANDKNRAGIMLDAASNQGSGSNPEVRAWASSASNFDDLASALAADLKSMGTVCSLSLTYGGGKWRVLVAYLTAVSGETYRLYSDSDSSASKLESHMNSNLSSANSVVAFGYSYAGGTNAAMAIYT